MADVESVAVNKVETTLTSAPGESTTLEVASATGLPPEGAARWYAILDMADDAKYEVIAVTARSGTTLTVERYLPGSAAASGIVHAIGATLTVAMVAQYLEDLHDRIDADATAAASAHTTLGGEIDAAEARLDSLEAIDHAEDHASRHATAGADHLGAQIGGYIEIDVAVESSVDATTSTTWETGASISFTKPASWTSYKVLAWGGVGFRNVSASAQMEARTSIEGTAGTAVSAQSVEGVDQPFSIHATSDKAGITGDATIAIQYRKQSGTTGYKAWSTISMIAIRTA